MLFLYITLVFDKINAEIIKKLKKTSIFAVIISNFAEKAVVSVQIEFTVAL